MLDPLIKGEFRQTCERGVKIMFKSLNSLFFNNLSFWKNL